LDIIWDLGIEIWDFNTVSKKENPFFLNPLELTFTLPLGPCRAEVDI
jgi:hypothetical protein